MSEGVLSTPCEAALALCFSEIGFRGNIVHSTVIAEIILRICRTRYWLGSMYMFNACLTALKIGRLSHAERFVRKLRFCKVHLIILLLFLNEK